MRPEASVNSTKGRPQGDPPVLGDLARLPKVTMTNLTCLRNASKVPRPQAPSNTAPSTPKTDPHPYMGVDTVAVRLPYVEHSLATTRVVQRLNRDTGQVLTYSGGAYEMSPGLPVMVKADDRHGKFIRLEWSVPRLMKGNNTQAATAEEVLNCAQAVYDDVSRQVEFAGPWSDMTVSRLDLVRDVHGVEEVGPLLRLLSSVPGAGGSRRHLYNDPQRGNAETLQIASPGRWSVTAYDKAAEQVTAASRSRGDLERAHHLEQAQRADGQLRLEICLRGPVVPKRLGTTRLVDAMEETIMNDAAQHYFKATRLNTPVGGVKRLDAALARMALHPKHSKMATRLTGILYQQARGLRPTESRNTMAKYLAVARLYGLTAADLVLEDRPTVRVDWDTATVIIEDAA